MSPRVFVRPILAIQGVLVLLLAALWIRTPLVFDWPSIAPTLYLIAAALAGWAYYRRWPGGPDEAVYPDTLLMLALLLMLGCVIGAGQYVMLAQRRPLVDAALLRMDSLMGISVPDLVAWTQARPIAVTVARFAYVTLIPQFFFGLLVLGFVFKDRAAIWEFGFHAHVCLLVTLLCVWAWPAIGVYAESGTPALMNLNRFFRHFAALRSGQPMVVRFDDLEGLVSFPSFHVAGAWIVTWAFRRSRLFRLPLLVLNLLLTASTLLLGVHYGVDLVATAAMCGLSLWLYRLYRQAASAVTGARGLTQARSPAAPCPDPWD